MEATLSMFQVKIGHTCEDDASGLSGSTSFRSNPFVDKKSDNDVVDDNVVLTSMSYLANASESKTNVYEALEMLINLLMTLICT